MSLVLIDTSMWIEFFSKQPTVSKATLSLLHEIISDGEAAIIEPVRAELLSGHIAPKLKEAIAASLMALDAIDLDWASRGTWNEIIALADTARRFHCPIPGIVDRMIILSAMKSEAAIASKDKSLLRLASCIDLKIWP